MNEFHELEYKYEADNVGLESFINLMNNLEYNKRLDISSWDFYYTKKDNNDYDEFIRFRNSHSEPELTKKKKTKDSNNWARIECDLPLDAKRLKHSTVQKFIEMEGYEENFKIYKSCFIFWQEYVNYVYYIVYDKQMKEQGRFIEVEFNKDKINKFPQTVIGLDTPLFGESKKITHQDFLKEKEKELETLGITNKNRLKKSLFERFRK